MIERSSGRSTDRLAETRDPENTVRVGAGRVAARFLRHESAALGAAIVLIMALLAAAAPWITPYPPDAADFTAVLQGPSAAHWFGTDQLGRDVFTRVVHGGRISLLIGLFAVSLGAAIGVPMGAVAGFYGGWTDRLVQRAVDLLLAFPSFLLALVFIAILGVGQLNVVISVGLSSVPIYIRLVRGTVLTLREALFVESARATGLRSHQVLARHVLPNTLTPVLVQSTLQVGTAILTAAGLGFLGLGVQPPTAEWGTMVGEGQTYLYSAWWIETFPGLAIFLAVMGFNLMGDGLRDALDPRGEVRL